MAKVILGAILFLLVVGLLIFLPTFMKEGNAFVVLKGAINVSISKSEVAKINNDPEKYISKSSEGKYPMVNFMEKEGWKYEEQIGAGYIFVRAKTDENSRRLLVSNGQCTSMFTVWKLETQ